MRQAYFWAIAVAVPSATSVAPEQAVAAVTSAADRARIAQLVYLSASARQADLRRGDEVTRTLRTKAENAQKQAAATRTELVKARSEGAAAKTQAHVLERKLAEQERALAEAAETYTGELAKRDEEYARERSILISTGERLLKTPEGSRVLDLYNAGGEANWKNARRIMDEARRTRRALDARDAAVLYRGAWARGLETTSALVDVWEEYVRDEAADWSAWDTLSHAYLASDQHVKATLAARRMVQLSPDDWHRINSLVRLANAEANSKSGNARTTSTEAVASARRYLLKVETANAAERIIPARQLLALALYLNGRIIGDEGRWKEAKTVAEASLGILDLPRNRMAGAGVWLTHVNVLLLLGDAHLKIGQSASGLAFYRRAREAAQGYFKRSLDKYDFTELTAWAACGMGEAALKLGAPNDALTSIKECEAIFRQLAQMDPGLPSHRENALHVQALLDEASARVSSQGIGKSVQ